MRPPLEALESRQLFAGTVLMPFGSGTPIDTQAVGDQVVFRTGKTASQSVSVHNLWVTDGRSSPRLLASIETDGKVIDYLGSSLGRLWYSRYKASGFLSDYPKELIAVEVATGRVRDLGETSSALVYLGSTARSAIFRGPDGFGVYFRSDGKSVSSLPANEAAPFEALPEDAIVGEKYAYYDTLKNHVREVWQSAKDGSSRTRVLSTTGPVTLVPHEGKVLIIDQRQTYLLNGKRGVAKAFSSALKLTGVYDDRRNYASIGSHVIKLGEGLWSLNLTTGKSIQILDASAFTQTVSGVDIAVADGNAYLAARGRVDGETIDASFAGVRSAVEVAGRAVFIGDDGALRVSRRSVVGIVFNDENRNSAQDADETGSAGRRVFLDLNRDGRWQKREPSDFADSRGQYALYDIAGSTVDVGVSPDAAHLNPGTRTVKLGEDAIRRDFALPPAGLIRVNVFADRNEDGMRDGQETPWSLVDFWLDLDRDGMVDADEPAAINTYAYTFGNLAAGRYQLRARLRTQDLAGFVYRFTTPAVYEVKITSGSRTRDFGVAFVSDGTPS